MLVRKPYRKPTGNIKNYSGRNGDYYGTERGIVKKKEY
jgi:hypothetical protein